MNIIPLLHMKKKRIRTTQDAVIQVREVFKRIKKDTELYILDDDGITENKPNLSLYQQLSERYTLWVDTGPRSLGEVMDVVMAGATTVVVRTYRWPKIDLANIREITECDIYAILENDKEPMLLSEVNGLVFFPVKDQTEENNSPHPLLRGFIEKLPIYVYEPDPKKEHDWEAAGVTGVLIDIENIEENKTYGP